MKTILVLTDFSINAAYTAQYALELAQNIEANLLLCNVYEDKQTDQPARKTWPLGEVEENSISDLGALMGLLKTRMDADQDKDKFRPGINQCSEQGLLGDVLNDLVKRQSIVLGVMSIHSSTRLSKLFTGNNAREIIEKANFPLLVVPYQVRFKPYKTIAFATAMNYSDINVLQSLSGLAEHSGSDILITRVIANTEETEITIKNFFNQIPLKITYPKILYRTIKSKSVTNALQWLTALRQIDLLVLVRRKPNFFRRLFKSSIVQKMALRPGKPLLIFLVHNCAGRCLFFRVICF
jgi:nucleotide-binding universal stress UspA family protein